MTPDNHKDSLTPKKGKPQRGQLKRNHLDEATAAVETKDNLEKDTDPRKVKTRGEEQAVKMKRTKKTKVKADVSIELGFMFDEL